MRNGNHTALPLSEFSGLSLSHDRSPTRHRRRRQVVSHKHRNRTLHGSGGVSYFHRSLRNPRHKFTLRFFFFSVVTRMLLFSSRLMSFSRLLSHTLFT
jgi:hypothetical protein